MDTRKIIDTHIESSYLLPAPGDLIDQLPLSEAAAETVMVGRQAIADIVDGHDSRKFIVVGPCSIHDTKAAIDYAQRLKRLADRVADKFLIIMRVYFEKPRTTVGWKGLINDPFLDGTFHIEQGLTIARRLLIQVADLGLPAGTEALDPITPQYLSDLVSWAAIGARTIESQTHREMASGLSMPVGLKNGTDGNVKVAIDALEASRTPHNFLGMNEAGQVSVFRTKGNPFGHIILRGGGGKPNYDAHTVQMVEAQLAERGLPKRVVIDCSHGNSNKDHKKQSAVFNNIIDQMNAGNTSIIGAMLESNLFEGNQPIRSDKSDMVYGVSITDKCISWADTEQLILAAYDRLKVPVTV
ncbi:MAG: 3-deoxy-7-phosphoheptulonate synthase [Leptolyngbyaceae bacterium]|nr:3-deoxy-7-phosphoheptulonate synthase [Leptolyngbyaceae bacterium]